VCKADNLVMKSGNLNFLEPSGPVQTCNGPALPFKNIYYTAMTLTSPHCEAGEGFYFTKVIPQTFRV